MSTATAHDGDALRRCCLCCCWSTLCRLTSLFLSMAATRSWYTPSTYSTETWKADTAAA